MKEASRTVREMPSLVVFPVFLVISGAICSWFMMQIWLGMATLEPENVELFLIKLGVNDPGNFQRIQQAGMWGIIFGFLWIYFFHTGLFTCLVASSVSHWYFYRQDPERSAGTGINSGGWYFGRPLVRSCGRICSYHLGSVAFGSWVMTMVTMPRIILEYLANQSKAEDQTEVTKCVVRATRCCLWCFQKCVEFITTYAYVYIAVTGKPFCTSCHATFVLFAKYPAQVALDEMAAAALGGLACVTVPALMVMTSALVLQSDAFAPALFILILSYCTTRFVVGVYDICVTTLFVCLMRDIEHYGGRYMTEGLAEVCGIEYKGPQPPDDGKPQIELTEPLADS